MQESPLTPTEQRAINHAIPILQTMAANTTSAIQALSEKGRPVENNGPVFNDNFHDHMLAVEANAAQAEKIFQSLRPYEETRGPLESRQEQKANPDAAQPRSRTLINGGDGRGDQAPFIERRTEAKCVAS